mgnify:CR=1 FL=1
MRAVLTRVNSASVTIDGEVVGKIGRGFLILLGVGPEDTEAECRVLAEKCLGLRIFKDENDKLSLNASAVGGSVMLISNFVLAGRVTRGFRPDCTHAAKYEEGKRMFDALAEEIGKALPTVTGVFGAHMEIEVHNDGPINVIIDTKELRK